MRLKYIGKFDIFKILYFLCRSLLSFGFWKLSYFLGRASLTISRLVSNGVCVVSALRGQCSKKTVYFFATLTYISYVLKKSTVHNSAQCIFVTTTEGLGQWRKWVDVVVTYQWRRQPPLGSLVTHHPPNISYTNSLALHSDSILICYILPTYLHWILVAGLRSPAQTESLQC